MQTRATELRTDIQALRGIAVLMVLFYHAQIGGLQAGYLGVDIFFVVSGFLITGLVARGIQAGSFSFREFYFRRAKRLLPASLTVLALTGLAAGFLLTEIEQHDFWQQLAGSLTFVVNYVLLDQADYFSGKADLKPLLHMWSLAIEEQYYLLLPAALYFLHSRHWKLAILATTAVSLIFCLILANTNAKAAFYLLPTRLWELGLGSIGALVLTGGRWQAWARVLFWPALVVLFVLPFFPLSALHPGPDAIVVCLATLVLILAHAGRVGASTPARALAWVGDWSYALYLVHWPLFAFAQNVYFSSTVPTEMRATLLVASLVLGYLLYRLVETPIRRADLSAVWPNIRWFVYGSVAVMVTPFVGFFAMPADKDYASLRQKNYGFSSACVSGDTYRANPECQSADAPKILVWGDSFGMHLVPGIAADAEVGVAQATRSVCGPFANLAPTSSAAWAEWCIGFNRSVLASIEDSPIEVVVLSSPYNQYLEPGAKVLSFNGEEADVRDGTVEIALGALRETAEAVRATGRRVVLVSPPPRGDFDTGLCVERRDSGRLLLGPYRECALTMDLYAKTYPGVVEFLDRAPAEAGVPVVRLDQFLCDESGDCLTVIDDILVYRDPHHLSVAGSVALAKRFGLAERILKEAR